MHFECCTIHVIAANVKIRSALQRTPSSTRLLLRGILHTYRHFHAVSQTVRLTLLVCQLIIMCLCLYVLLCLCNIE